MEMDLYLTIGEVRGREERKERRERRRGNGSERKVIVCISNDITFYVKRFLGFGLN